MRFQVDSFNKNLTTILDTDIKEKLKELEYPLHFLDFETYSTAIPEFDNSWPYEQIPFQYSLHIQDKPGDELRHIEFLAEVSADPRKKFAESLVKNIGKKGSIVVFNKTFETRIMNDLSGIFPELESTFNLFISRLFDLMTPFRKKHYYKPEMKGSYSIKKVLPALVPDLSYEDLEIANGGDASTAYYNLKFVEDRDKIEQVRKSLLQYCGLDTLAMVKILEVLHSVPE